MTPTYRTTITQPPRPAVYGDWPTWAYPPLITQLADEYSITRPYQHQSLTATTAHDGRHVIVATGTSSGKSLGYQLPALTDLARDPAACALDLTPTKALGNDQLTAILRLCRADPALASINPAPYDGDTPTEARRTIRATSRYLVTNPDMLHGGILAYPDLWRRLLANLRYVIVDEAHQYRGVFGAHVSLVLRRLLRLAQRAQQPRGNVWEGGRKSGVGAGGHGGREPKTGGPVVILASATSNNPAQHAAQLIGDPDVVAVTEDGSPRGRRTIILTEAGPADSPGGALGEDSGEASGGGTGEGLAADAGEGLAADAGDEGRQADVRPGDRRRSVTTEAALLMADFLVEGARTLVFTKSRAGAELVALRAQTELARVGRPDLGARVAAYRAGYLAADRRRIELALDDGELLGVAATNALELGIDIGGLDAVITAGFPGTLASFWQQAGRAGRRNQAATVVLIASADPLDAYLVHHPDALISRPVEAAVFDPTNPHILAGHVLCAALEAPLTDREVAWFRAGPVVDRLVTDGWLRRRPRGYYAAVPPGQPDPHRVVSVRGSGREVTIVESTTGRVVGTVDAGQAASQVHPGAVYLHQGHSYVVDELSLAEGVALVHGEMPDYFTQALSSTTIRVVSAPDAACDEVAPGLLVANMLVEVTRQVTGYVVRDPGGATLAAVPLGMPPESLVTRAVAITIDPVVLAELGIQDVPGTLHAMEHALIGLLPLVATCDRWDIGGVSTALHQDTGLPTVFVYDGYPGGAGFADCGFSRFGEWVSATAVTVAGCGCESGCPSCVQSPKCGNGNQPLDKRGAIALLQKICSMLDG